MLQGRFTLPRHGSDKKNNGTKKCSKVTLFTHPILYRAKHCKITF